MRPRKLSKPLVWIDMEMTGLDPQKEGILEIATVVTDDKLNLIAHGPCLVIRQDEMLLRAMGSWNQRHHRQSGLLKEARTSGVSTTEAETRTLAFLKQHCLPRKAVLCGNAVHHDRTFMIRWMPRLHRFLHYRHIDVSTVKELVRRWYPKDRHRPKKRACHRALSDILESIEELRYYRKRYFR